MMIHANVKNIEQLSVAGLSRFYSFYRLMNYNWPLDSKINFWSVEINGTCHPKLRVGTFQKMSLNTKKMIVCWQFWSPLSLPNEELANISETYLTFITARVRSTTGRYCFHRCLSVHTGGGGTLDKVGTTSPPARSGVPQGRYPSPGQVRAGGEEGYPKVGTPPPREYRVTMAEELRNLPIQGDYVTPPP